MTELVILVPVLNRPQNALPLIQSISAATRTPHRVLFLCSPNDDAEIEAARATGADVHIVDQPPGPGDFARKTNRGLRLTTEPWLFAGADDLRFHPNWDVEALAVAENRAASVVGTNDLWNPQVLRGKLSTHSLIRRSYAEDPGCVFDDRFSIYCEHYDHQWCTPAETPIWMGDLSFRSIIDVEVGDEVIGWERSTVNPSDPAVAGMVLSMLGSNRGVAKEMDISPTQVQAIRTGKPLHTAARRWKAPLRRLQRTRVLAVQTRFAPLVSVTLESGRSLVCTPEHRWLNGKYSPSTRYGKEWIRAEVGRTLLHVADPSEPLPPEDQRLAGWLGGIHDGEGSGAPNPQIGQSREKNLLIYERICSTLGHFRIPYKRADDRVWLKGGRKELLRFINIAQPYRSARLIDYIIGSSRFGMKDRVVAVEHCGAGRVYSLATTTGNYVAWGYASHNCDVELVDTARVRGQWAFAKRSIVEHLHPYAKKSEMDPTYEKALARGREDANLYYRRRRLWTRRRVGV